MSNVVQQDGCIYTEDMVINVSEFGNDEYVDWWDLEIRQDRQDWSVSICGAQIPFDHFEKDNMNHFYLIKPEGFEPKNKPDYPQFGRESVVLDGHCHVCKELKTKVEKLEARLKPLLKFEHATLVSVKNGEDK